jgi:hypothetical protein
MTLRLDDDDPLFAQAAIVTRQQSGLDRLGQRRGGDVEAQMDRTRYLVDVARPPWARTALTSTSARRRRP